MATAGAKETRLKVFISYSRKDSNFAQQLFQALELRGIAAMIDERDLPKLEDWRRELSGAIREADAVVFIVSSNSIASPVCGWEIEQVTALNKRLAPIVFERIQDDKIPAAAAKINYIYFDEPASFDARADELARALQADIGWLKEHTRLGELARRWDERRRPSGLHLRGQDLLEAERWISRRPHSAPPPTKLHRDLISSSRRGAKIRRGRAAAIAVAVVMICLGIWEGQAWLSVRNHIGAQHYQRYLDSTLPVHAFRSAAMQRLLEDRALRAVPEGDDEAYRRFADMHPEGPYGKLARIIHQRRSGNTALRTIFSDSTRRELSRDELAHLDCDGLLIARNEINYRLGHCFCTTWGVKFFPNFDCDGVVDANDVASFASNNLVGVRGANSNLLVREYADRKCVLPVIERTACKASR